MNRSFLIGCIIATIGLIGLFLTIIGGVNIYNNCDYVNCQIENKSGQCYIAIVNSTLPDCPMKDCPLAYDNYSCYFDLTSNCPKIGTCINNIFLTLLILGCIMMAVSIISGITKLICFCCQ